MQITSYAFGKIVIDGNTYTRDIKIIRGRIIPEWWREQGHLLQMVDIPDIVRDAPHTLVVGTGASGLMRVAGDVPEMLGKAGIRLEAMPTRFAIERYEELVSIQGEDRVAAAFHLTC